MREFGGRIRLIREATIDRIRSLRNSGYLRRYRHRPGVQLHLPMAFCALEQRIFHREFSLHADVIHCSRNERVRSLDPPD